jgi:flagellin-like protein
MKLWKEMRGISPLVATLILIAATVAGGAIVYGVMRSQMSSLAGGADLQITYADVIVAGNTKRATVTVQNTGTVALSSVTATIYDNAGNSLIPTISIGTLNAGQTSGGTADNSSWTNVVTGAQCVIKVTASTPDGGSVTKTTVVVAHS